MRANARYNNVLARPFFYEKGLKREVRKLSPLLDISKSENENWLWICFSVVIFIFDALRDLVPFVKFEKREKHPWRSVTFSKVSGRLVSQGCCWFGKTKNLASDSPLRSMISPTYLWYNITSHYSNDCNYFFHNIGVTRLTRTGRNDDPIAIPSFWS